MNIENTPPLYKGKFLKDIVKEYSVSTLCFDEGTLLIQETDDIRVFFQLEREYTYYNEWLRKSDITLRRGIHNTPLEMLSGSVIDNHKRMLPDKKSFCLPQHVRIPMDEEVMWYEEQNIV